MRGNLQPKSITSAKRPTDGLIPDNWVLCHWLAAAKSIQSCLTLCGPTDGSPPGSPIPGILQAKILEWVAIFFSNAWKGKGKGKWLSRVWLFMTSWTTAYQAPPYMGFSRQEYWSGLPLPSPHWLGRGLILIREYSRLKH